MDWSPEELAFRDEVRTFLDAELTPAMRAEARRMTSVYAPHELSLAWQAILHARGWAAPAWPIEHGGCGWTPAQRYIFASELAAADAPLSLPYTTFRLRASAAALAFIWTSFSLADSSQWCRSVRKSCISAASCRTRIWAAVASCGTTIDTQY